MTATGTPPPPSPSAPPPDRPRRGWGFDRSRLRLGLVLGVVAGALAFLLVQGLGEATLYFRNVDEAVAMRDELGTARFRLQGTVTDDVRPEGDGVAFGVTYDGASVAVVHRGDPPELFQPGIPVVLEGAFVPGGERFESDRMFVRHTEEYRAEHGERLEDAGEAEAS